MTTLALINLLNKAAQALDVLAQDIEDTYPARSESAIDLAVEIRDGIREAGYKVEM